MTEEEISPACVEYGRQLDELQRLTRDIYPKNNIGEVTSASKSSMAFDVKPIKVNAVPSKPGPDSPELREAVQNAIDISKKMGSTSPEARVAWDVVEEIAAAGTDDNAYAGRSFDQECFVDAAMDACEALDELNKAMDAHARKNQKPLVDVDAIADTAGQVWGNLKSAIDNVWKK